MIIRMYPTCGLKGQQANSPGHRPGYSGQTTFALKGQKHYIWVSTKVMAYEADFLYTGFCPYRAWAQEGMSVVAPRHLTKYLSATEYEERQVANSMYLCSESFHLGIE